MLDRIVGLQMIFQSSPKEAADSDDEDCVHRSNPVRTQVKHKICCCITSLCSKSNSLLFQARSTQLVGDLILGATAKEMFLSLLDLMSTIDDVTAATFVVS